MPFTKTRKSSLRKKYTKKSKSLPARLQPSLTRYITNKALYAVQKKYSESKLIGVSRINEHQPIPCQPSGAFLRGYWNGFVLGDQVPTGWGTPSEWTTLSGVATIPGDLSNNRQGNYMYLNKTHITMDIEMKGNPQGEFPIQEFRVIIFKERSTIPTGINHDPKASLFLDEFGRDSGHVTSIVGMTPRDLMVKPLNKRFFSILKDVSFKLRDGGWNADGKSLDSHKRIICDLPHNIKAKYHYSADPTTASEPSNYNYKYGIVVYSRVIGDPAQDADRHRVSIRGSTSATDN